MQAVDKVTRGASVIAVAGFLGETRLIDNVDL